MSPFGLVSATEAVLTPVADASLDALRTFDDQPSVLWSPHPQLGSLMDFEYYDRQELHTISIAAKKRKSLNDAGSYAVQASSSGTASPITASRSPVIGAAPSSPIIHSPSTTRQRLSMSPRVRALSRAASLEDAISEASSTTTASQTPSRIAALAPLSSSAIPSPHILLPSSPTSPTAPTAARPALPPILVRRRSALLRPRSPASIPSPTSPALGDTSLKFPVDPVKVEYTGQWSIDSAPVSIACLAECLAEKKQVRVELELETDAKRGTARVGETETATVERSEVRDFSLAVISILPAFIGASISSATWKIQRGWHLSGPQGSRTQEKRGRNEVRDMSSLALLMAGVVGTMPVAHAANIGRQLTTTTGTTTTSAGSSTATLSPTFIFSSVDEMSTCEGADIKWVYAGPDAQVRLEISSIDVIQSGAPSSTTSQTVSRSLHLTMSDGTLTPARREATGIITSEAASPSSGGITSLISTDIRASARTFTWSSVEVPQGWYHLNASIPSRNYVANLSPSFYVRNGADTSCLLGASTTTTSGSQGAETSSSATGSSATAVAVGASSSDSVDAGTIAGAVIGSIAGVTLLAGAFLWFFCRRRRQHKRTPSGVETASMRQTKPSKQPKPYATNGPFGLQHHHRSSDGSQGHILSHASHGSASESTVGACTSPTSESEEKLESAVPTRANSHEQRRSAEAPRRASTEHRRTPSYPPQAPTPEVTPPAAAVTRAPTTRKTPRKPVPSYIAAEETSSAPASPTTPAAAASASSAPALVHRSSDNSVKGSVNTVDTPGGKTSRRRSLQAKGEAERGRVGHYAVGSARSATLDPTRPDLKNKNSWDERPMHFLIPDMPPPPPQ